VSIQPPKQEQVRKAIDQCARGRAESERRSGRLPDSRRIEQHWQEIARHNDRKQSDGR
jgi:hypothetical protein